MNYAAFQRYYDAVTRFFNGRGSGLKSVEDWAGEVADACESVHAAHLRQIKKMKMEGVEHLIGLAVTAAPFLIPEIPKEVLAAITAVVGPRRLYDASKWLWSAHKLRQKTSDLDLWSAWSDSKTAG